MAALTQASAGYVSDETVNVFAFDEFIQAQPVMPTLYTQEGSSVYRESIASMSGLGEFEEKTPLADPTEDTPVQQFKAEFLHKEFALMVRVERKVYDDQNFPFFQQLGRKIGEAAMRKIEKDSAAVFNEAFSSSTYLAEDGLTLCNGAHLNVDGGNSQSNSGTSAMSYSVVGTTQTAMRRFSGYRGEEIVVEPDLLLYPDELDATAMTIINSSGNPTSANLEANYQRGRFVGVSWGYLSRSDVNNWFMIDRRLMKQNLFWKWRLPLETFGGGDAFKGEHKIGGYYRSSHRAVDWRWVYGHAV